MKFAGHRAWRGAAALTLALAAGGCSGRGDSAPVLDAVMKTLTSDGRAICIDAETSGEPLAIFRTMIVSPDPSRRPLAWQAPQPLRPDQNLSLGRMINDEFRQQRVVLRRPVSVSTSVLPATEQRRLDAAAKSLSLADRDRSARVSDSAEAPRARAHWWVRNRFDRSCNPVYAASDPVVVGDMAFVTITAGHWGTIYAVERKGNRWATTARWSNWLY